MRVLLLCACMLVATRAIADEDLAIYRMMVDGQIFQLGKTRQIASLSDGNIVSACISPDGKYIAYVEEHFGDPQVCLVRSNGDRPIVVMAMPPEFFNEGFVGEVWRPVVRSRSSVTFSSKSLLGGISWSPDNRLIAFPAVHIVCKDDKQSQEYGIVVLRSTGAIRAFFALQDKAYIAGPILWSPDSRRFAGVFIVSDPGLRPTQTRDDLLAFDISSGSVQVLFSQPISGYIHPESWSRTSKALYYVVTHDKEKAQLRETSLDGKVDKVVQDDYSHRPKSPDGVYKLADRPGISVENSLTGEVIDIIETPVGDVLGWSPNSKMLAYQRPMVVKDETGKRKETLNMLWLAAAEANPINHMCVAFHSQESRAPTWSQDCLKMVYVCAGQACVAEFAWRELTVYDKLEAGIPLTEEEEQAILVNHSKMIATAMHQYANDHNDEFPSAETFMQDILRYFDGRDPFLRPGTDQLVFQYFPQSDGNQTASPADTIVGIFDVGYGWQVVVYLDGHVQVVRKQ